MRALRTTAPRGFSLIELVAVLVIIAALAVFAAPRLDTAGFERFNFHEELLAAARHAQKTATATRCPVRFRVDATADSYSATFDGDGPPDSGAGPPQCSAGTPLLAPGGGGNLASTAPDAVDVTSGATVTFNGFGVPSGAATVTLDGGRQVVIETNTGYVHD